MGFSAPHAIIIVAIIVIFIALLFQTIGLGAPGWLVIEPLRIGLWETCFDGSKKCYELGTKSIPSWWEASRAFGLLGIFAMAASFLCGLLLCFISSLQKIFFMCAPITAVAGAIFSIIEWAIFLGKASEPERDYLGYSFGLAVTASILCFIAAICFLLGRNTMGVS